MTKPTAAETSILANLELLKARLSAAASLAGDAARAMRGGERNLAIGTIIPFETLLPEIDLLYRICIMLHRSPPHIDAISDTQELAAQALREALVALNTAPCFRVPSLPGRTKSYDIAQRIEKVLAEIAPPTEPP
jgi:hypothetical protein